MRTSTACLLGIVVAAGCSGSAEDSVSNNPHSQKTDGGAGADAQGAQGGASGAGAPDASDAAPCAPRTCSQLGASCGTAPDACGGVVSCGSCNAGQVCGGAGANKCGSGTCTPKTCIQLGASCGWASDQCGSAVDCGSCPAGQTCSASNQCSGAGAGGSGSGGSAGGAAGSAGQGGSGQGGSGQGGSGQGGSGQGGSGQGGSGPTCSTVCSGHCGTYQGCACGGCSGSLVCNNGTCADCQNGDTESSYCDPAMYCPPGSQDRTCTGGDWGSWSECSADATDFRYYGDGGTHCGAVVCIQVTGYGSNTTLAVTISKVGGMVFDNNTDITLQPSGATPKWYYCVPTQGKSSYTINVSPSDFGMTLGETASINAWVWSPCNSSVGYQTEDAYISQCKP